MGKYLYKEIIDRAFDELNLESVIVLFPPTRTRVQGLLKMGFIEEGELFINDELFIKYRLNKVR